MNLFNKPNANKDEVATVMREVDNVLKSSRVKPDVLKTLVKFIDSELSHAASVIIIWEQSGKKTETYWDCGGIEPAQAILSLDQLHHRIQHQGLPGYD